MSYAIYDASYQQRLIIKSLEGGKTVQLSELIPNCAPTVDSLRSQISRLRKKGFRIYSGGGGYVMVASTPATAFMDEVLRLHPVLSDGMIATEGGVK